jgi:hypothetical protein
MPRQKGRQVPPCGTDPWSPVSPMETDPSGKVSQGKPFSKAPPRNPKEIPSGNSFGRSDGTWDHLSMSKRLRTFPQWIGFRRSVGLPSFPFPGRDSNRKTDLIEGRFPWVRSSSEDRILRKTHRRGLPKTPPLLPSGCKGSVTGKPREIPYDRHPPGPREESPP